MHPPRGRRETVMTGPRPGGRGTKAVGAERQQRIEQLAAKRYTTEQIALSMRITRQSVAARLKKAKWVRDDDTHIWTKP